MIKMPGLDHSGTDAQKEDSLFGILRAEFGHRRVETRLANGVRGASLDVVFGDEVDVRVAGGKSDHFLGVASDDEWREQVEQVDVADNVDFKAVEQVLFEGFVLLAPVFLPLVPTEITVDGIGHISQNTDSIVAVKLRHQSCVGNQVVQASAGDIARGS